MWAHHSRFSFFSDQESAGKFLVNHCCLSEVCGFLLCICGTLTQFHVIVPVRNILVLQEIWVHVVFLKNEKQC